MDAPEDKPKRQPRQGGGGGRVGERQTPEPEQLDEPRQERRGSAVKLPALSSFATPPAEELFWPGGRSVQAGQWSFTPKAGQP